MKSLPQRVLLWPILIGISFLLLAITTTGADYFSLSDSRIGKLLGERAEVIANLSFAYAVLAAILAL